MLVFLSAGAAALGLRYLWDGRSVPVWAASVAVGLVWGAWHSMDFLIGNWTATPALVGLFIGYIVAGSVLVGTFYNWSGGSVFVAMIAHVSANAVNGLLPVWNWNAAPRTPLLYLGLLALLAVVMCARRGRPVDSNHRQPGGVGRGNV